jgi:hypothetical protein
MLNFKNFIEKLLSHFMPVFKKPSVLDVLVDDKYKFDILILDAKKNLEHAEFHLSYLIKSRDRICEDIKVIKQEQAQEALQNNTDKTRLLNISNTDIPMPQNTAMSGFKQYPTLRPVKHAAYENK